MGEFVDNCDHKVIPLYGTGSKSSPTVSSCSQRAPLSLWLSWPALATTSGAGCHHPQIKLQTIYPEIPLTVKELAVSMKRQSCQMSGRTTGRISEDVPIPVTKTAI